MFETLCGFLASGPKTFNYCVEVAAAIAERGFYPLSEVKEVAKRKAIETWLRKHRRSVGLFTLKRIPRCDGTRGVSAIVAVDPENPPSSPGFLLASIVPQMRMFGGYCIRKVDLNDEEVEAWHLRGAAELLCRVFGPGRRSVMELDACVSILYSIFRYGYARPSSDKTLRNVLTYLKAKGVLERRRQPWCENINVTLSAYALNRKMWPQLSRELIRFTIVPPSCI